MATPDLRRTQICEPAMRRIPEGWFTMGCDAGRDDEKPAHRVWVDAFELATFQTTNAEYARFLEETRHPPPPLRDDPNFNNPKQPVVAVSWFEAVAYCDWLSRTLGKHVRLPTEAEWERAARGGVEGETFPWGECPPEELPDYASRWKTGPEPVGLYAPNPYGLFNLGDNVHEWCADWYDAGLLCRFARAKSARAAHQQPPRLARRLVAPSHQGDADGGAFQHSSGIQICGLRFSHRLRRRFPLGAVTPGVPS